MKDLICMTSNCEHCVLNRCEAGIINVTGRGVCATRQRREGGVLSQNYADMEASSELTPHGNADVSVQCDANCIYNRDYKCHADAITLEDGIINTRCSTKTKSRS